MLWGTELQLESPSIALDELEIDMRRATVQVAHFNIKLLPSIRAAAFHAFDDESFSPTISHVSRAGQSQMSISMEIEAFWHVRNHVGALCLRCLMK